MSRGATARHPPCFPPDPPRVDTCAGCGDDGFLAGERSGVKILILKPSSLGDVVQALPVLRLLRRHDSAHEIYWWIDRGLAPLLEGDPDLQGLFAFARQGADGLSRWRHLLREVRAMRARRFDWVIDLQGLARSGLVAWLANGGLTVGMDDRREGAPGFYDLAVRRPSPMTHAVDWYLEVLRVLGVPRDGSFSWLPERLEVADGLRRRWPVLAEGRWLALVPGARWLNKRWPVDHFVALVRRLAADDPELRFMVLGGLEDHPLGALTASAAPDRSLDLTGRTSLTEMVECVRRSALAVTNDSGPMHVAAAIGRPVVALFGPTEPRRTGPYGQVGKVLQSAEIACVPCMKDRCRHAVHLACLQELGPERVAETVRRQLTSAVDLTDRACRGADRRDRHTSARSRMPDGRP